MQEDYLRFFSYHQPRRIRVIENILKNRRTVANLFWAQQYGIITFLGANRQLTRKHYDDTIKYLIDQKLITVDTDNQALLTEKGASIQLANEDSQYTPFFYDWFWVANTHLIMERLLLAVQVVSEYSYHQSQYIPLQISYSEMEAVKRWFRQNFHNDVVKKLFESLSQFGDAIASEDERLATDFFNMLVGHDMPGWTIEQASQHLKMSPENLILMRHDELLAIAAYALKVPGILQQLFLPILNKTPLSRSAQVSFNQYQQGYNAAQIAQYRHLKENTVREHFLEAAIMIPDQVDWDRLLPKEKRHQLSKVYQGSPSTWHYQENNDNQGFYDYRLYQIYQGGRHE